MTGYFWRTKDVNAFGAFTESLGSGLYHVADEKASPGVKLWSYGEGMDSSWSYLSTAKHQPISKFRAGHSVDQSIKTELGQIKPIGIWSFGFQQIGNSIFIP